MCGRSRTFFFFFGTDSFGRRKDGRHALEKGFTYFAIGYVSNTSYVVLCSLRKEWWNREEKILFSVRFPPSVPKNGGSSVLRSSTRRLSHSSLFQAMAILRKQLARCMFGIPLWSRCVYSFGCAIRRMLVAGWEKEVDQILTLFFLPCPVVDKKTVDKKIDPKVSPFLTQLDYISHSCAHWL